MKYGLLILLTAVLTGCGQTGSFKTGQKEVIIEVQKSPESVVEYRVEPIGQNLEEAMQNLAIPFETEEHDSTKTITKLSGVISTANKSWRLYISNESVANPDITEIKLDQPTTVSWRYEPKN